MLFIVKPSYKETFIKKMRERDISDIDFSIDWTGVEARVL